MEVLCTEVAAVVFHPLANRFAGLSGHVFVGSYGMPAFSMRSAPA